MAEWTPQLSRLGKPRYLAIADAIAEDIRSGRLAPADRLPPQRKLARRLDIDFTTVARGYVEAQRRGLIESRVGQGTFVRASAQAAARSDRAAPGNRRSVDESAAGAGRSRTARPHAGRPRSAWPRSGLSDALSGFRRRRRPTRKRRRIGCGIARSCRSRTACSSRRAPIRRCSAFSACCQSRRRAAVGIDHLSGRTLDRGATGLAACRPADGRRRRRCRRFRRACKRLAPRALYLNPTLLNPTTHTIRASRDAKPSSTLRADTACRSSRTILTASCRSHGPLAIRGARAGHHLACRGPRQMPRRRACASPMSSRPTCAPAGCLRRRCAPRP